MTERLRDCLDRWQIDKLLDRYPELRVGPSNGKHVTIAGILSFRAEAPGKEVIEDEYDVRLSVPWSFPNDLPSVHESGRRIPPTFHTLRDGSLCLGAPTRLRLLIGDSSSILRFVERCVIPYLYGYSYFTRHRELPFGELRHGVAGICQDLASVFGSDDECAIQEFVRLAAMRKRQANKHPCPCGTLRRLGQCHHRRINSVRKRLTRRWFQIVRNHLEQLTRPSDQESFATDGASGHSARIHRSMIPLQD